MNPEAPQFEKYWRDKIAKEVEAYGMNNRHHLRVDGFLLLGVMAYAIKHPYPVTR